MNKKTRSKRNNTSKKRYFRYRLINQSSFDKRAYRDVGKQYDNGKISTKEEGSQLYKKYRNRNKCNQMYAHNKGGKHNKNNNKNIYLAKRHKHFMRYTIRNKRRFKAILKSINKKSIVVDVLSVLFPMYNVQIKAIYNGYKVTIAIFKTGIAVKKLLDVMVVEDSTPRLVEESCKELYQILINMQSFMEGLKELFSTRANNSFNQ